MYIAVLILCIVAVAQSSPDQYTLAFVDWIDEIPPNAPPFMTVAVATHSSTLRGALYLLTHSGTVAVLAKDAINDGILPDILPNTRLELDVKVDGGNPAVSVKIQIVASIG